MPPKTAAAKSTLLSGHDWKYGDAILQSKIELEMAIRTLFTVIKGTSKGISESQSVAQKSWQSTAGNFEGKLKYIKENPLLADLTVRLVSNKKITEHKVHGIFFCMASEVFEKMIFSQFKEGLEKVIEMKNVKLEIFKLLLAFVYNQPVNLTSLNQAEDLLQLADYYLMGDLKIICASYCEKLDDVSTICYCIELAEKYDLPDLKMCKLKYIEENTEEVLQDQSFLKTNENTIASILDRDSLNLTEFDLFKFVENWIKHNLERKGKAIIDLLIPKLRYSSMTAREFAEGPIKSKYLNPDQLAALSYYHLTATYDLPLPPGLTKLERKCQVKLKFNTESVSTCDLSDCYIVMSSNKNFSVSGIYIFTLDGNKNEVYEENIIIKFCDSSSSRSNWPTILELKKQVHYSSELFIPTKKLSMQAGYSYCLHIHITNGIRKARSLNGLQATWKDFRISFSSYYTSDYYRNTMSDLSLICSIALFP